MTARDNTTFLPFAVPDIGEAEIEEVVDALRSGWITTGPKTKQFERDFVSFVGHDIEAIAVNSATAGLHLALEAVGVAPGDEVIVPTYTFTATAEVVRYLGAHPVIVDVDPHTLNLDPSRVAAAATARTRAVVPVHIAGLAAEMDQILEIAQAGGFCVVEDAAHALPTTYKGKMVGSLGTAATVFSFYANKTVTTGEGGMIVTGSEEIARRCRVMRLHGISRDAFDRYTSTTPSWRYEIIAPGFKYNLTDVASAIGIHQLRRAWEMRRRRENIVKRYDEGLAGLPLTLPAHPRQGDVHAWHLYIVRLGCEAAIGRDEFIEGMAARGVGCSVHYIPLHQHPYWRETYKLRPALFPAAEAAFTGAVSLPLYSRMSDEDVERVIVEVRGLLG